MDNNKVLTANRYDKLVEELKKLVAKGRAKAEQAAQ